MTPVMQEMYASVIFSSCEFLHLLIMVLLLDAYWFAAIIILGKRMLYGKHMQ
jgi:hypothetical protein